MNLSSEMGLCTLHSFCVSCSFDFSKSKSSFCIFLEMICFKQFRIQQRSQFQCRLKIQKLTLQNATTILKPDTNVWSSVWSPVWPPLWPLFGPLFGPWFFPLFGPLFFPLFGPLFFPLLGLRIGPRFGRLVGPIGFVPCLGPVRSPFLPLFGPLCYTLFWPPVCPRVQ